MRTETKEAEDGLFCGVDKQAYMHERYRCTRKCMMWKSGSENHRTCSKALSGRTGNNLFGNTTQCRIATRLTLTLIKVNLCHSGMVSEASIRAHAWLVFPNSEMVALRSAKALHLIKSMRKQAEFKLL